MNKPKVTTKEALDQYDRIKRGSKKKKGKLCQLCGNPHKNKGFNCTPCNEGIKQREQYRDWGDDTENYCGGY